MVLAMPGDLVGAYEIRQLLRVSRQRVQQLMKRADWPREVEKLAMGKVYARADIEAWARDHRREIREDDNGDPQDPPTAPAP
jgi:prophage regulatory protein